MPLFIVTVKLPRNPEHNPREKKTWPCPVQPEVTCTDATGEHHSYLAWGGLSVVYAQAERRWGHVTRVEEARFE